MTVTATSISGVDAVLGGRLLLGGDLVPGFIEIVDGLITRVEQGPAPAGARTVPVISPGFVDIHAHGGGGADFQTATPEAIGAVLATHRRHGTTSMVASLVTDSVDGLVAALTALSPYVDGRSLLGLHLEGPFLASGRCGAHDPALLVAPTPTDVDRLLEAGAGGLVMITIAPELPGAAEAIERFVGAGVRVAIGHTDASYDQVDGAIGSGATVATHLFNAMPPLHHREPGPVAALLGHADVTVELIADGVHLHPAVLRHAFAVAGADRVALISDAMAAAGDADGTYLLGGQQVVVTHGEARLSDGGSLAGSTLTMDRAVATAIAAGVDPADALRAATAAPADALGLSDTVGRIAVGRHADLVLLDERFGVQDVLIGGVPLVLQEATA